MTRSSTISPPTMVPAGNATWPKRFSVGLPLPVCTTAARTALEPISSPTLSGIKTHFAVVTALPTIDVPQRFVAHQITTV